MQVIENETFSVPGSNQTYQLRSQDPHGPYGGPMLQLLSGHYPTGPDQIALTPGVASELNLRVGDTWSQGGKTVVGIVQNPQSLLDEFALVPPGQVTHPTQVNVLFDARPGALKGSLADNVTTAGSANNNAISPETIVLALATVGMLLIALVSIGGFTVLAQRRMRALGMLESMGATDRNVRLVLEANGVIVGVVGALLGFAAGPGGVVGLPPAQRAERAPPHRDVRPAVERDRAGDGAGGHRNLLRRRLPRPRHHPRAGRQRAGRAPGAAAPDPPLVCSRRDRARHRVRLLLPFGRRARRRRREMADPRVRRADRGDHPGVAVLPGPAGPGRRQGAHRHPPVPARHGALPGPLRLRTLRHQPRRHDRGDHLRRGRRPLLQRLRLRRPEHGGERDQRVQPTDRPDLRSRRSDAARRTPAPSLESQEATVHAIASAVGATAIVELENPAAGLQSPSGSGRQWSGPIYVATPALLRAYGINPSSIPSNVDILSSRPGLAGSGVQLTYGGGGKGGGGFAGSREQAGNNTNACQPGSCVAHPVVQEESQLPTGTSAPNTVITESALHRLHIANQNSLGGWVLQANARSPRRRSPTPARWRPATT